ncbi:hypothetical protein NH288_10625 [Anaerococcus sp. NML200537]|uniref:hypothetical protein n=1 Tax=Anaerococcus sp. NML200537 TaxID=2954485 RepID=UPI0022387F45|nr:hypothetical protein [Anaerococcus sp. NML200537]MCW6702535.1 hypothetical protein [Anaerococcus sp. NML200537]
MTNEIIDESIYKDSPHEFFEDSQGFTKDLLDDAKLNLEKIRDGLYQAPAFLAYLKAHVPEKAYMAVLTKDDKRGLAKGTLQLLTRKNGSFLAELINPETNKIIKKVDLKEVDLTPHLDQARAQFMMQMQMAQISEDIRSIGQAIEAVRQGQQDDRLAIAKACKQKLIQARFIKSHTLRQSLYLKVISDAENSRNQLMLNQLAIIKFIEAIPKTGLQKFLGKTNTEEIDGKLAELMDGLNAINMVSLVEIMAYYELSEKEAALASFGYYRDFIQKAYFKSPNLVERLDSLDKSTNKIWKNTIYKVNSNILEISQNEILKLGNNHENS